METVWGVVEDEAGRPVPNADVFVGVRRVAGPATAEACERFGAPGGTGFLELVRTPTDARGEYRQSLPRSDQDADGAPNCVGVFAQWAGPDTAAGRDVLVNSPVRGMPLADAAQRVDLVLQSPADEGRARRHRSLHVEWAEMAGGRVPGFAGYFLEGCTVVVNLTDPAAQQDAARAYMLETLGDRRFSGPDRVCPQPPPLEFRKVRYDFAELHRWSGRSGVLLSLEGAVLHGISEDRNRIVVGFTDEAGRSRAERTLVTLDVPADVVVIEAPVAPIRPLGGAGAAR